jgi:ABC-2 type transport system ATP-binding protein
MHMAILETTGLTRKYGILTAVDHLDLAVNEGEVFGLIGPNGAGKSTVIKMLTTLLPPTSGTAGVAGFDIVKQSAKVRASIGYVPQLLSVDGALTGYENVLIFAKLYGVSAALRKERIDDAIEFAGLTGAADREVRGYSGGMVRRLELAMAMLHRPRVLFLDEPTVGLDPVARQEVWHQVQKLAADYGMTVLITTHFMDEADVLCGRIAIMNAGKRAALGSPDELKRSLNREGATLEDVFAHYTGKNLEAEHDRNYKNISETRNTFARMG